MKWLFIIGIGIFLSGCVSFSGIDWETSTGTEQGTDQGNPTHKMAYGTLLRIRWDVKK